MVAKGWFYGYDKRCMGKDQVWQFTHGSMARKKSEIKATS
jgi:hypothetical protein